MPKKYLLYSKNSLLLSKISFSVSKITITELNNINKICFLCINLNLEVKKQMKSKLLSGVLLFSVLGVILPVESHCIGEEHDHVRWKNSHDRWENDCSRWKNDPSRWENM